MLPNIQKEKKNLNVFWLKEQNKKEWLEHEFVKFTECIQKHFFFLWNVLESGHLKLSTINLATCLKYRIFSFDQYLKWFNMECNFEILVTIYVSKHLYYEIFLLICFLNLLLFIYFCEEKLATNVISFVHAIVAFSWAIL